MSKKYNIIITGASKGLGRAMVETIMLKYPKANVTAVARSQADLNDLVTKFGSSRVLAICGDITVKSTMEDAINGTLNKWGSIDGVIFNAGLLSPVQHLHDQNYDIEGAKRLFDVNYFSIVQFTNMLFNKLGISPREMKGEDANLNIIIVSTGSSTRACDGFLAYGSSKAAVNLLCAHIHQELYPIVRSVSVAPGVVDTNMQIDIRNQYKDAIIPEVYQKYVDLYNSGKLLNPMDVAVVYCKLVIDGIPDEVDGKYVRWNEIFSDV